MLRVRRLTILISTNKENITKIKKIITGPQTSVYFENRSHAKHAIMPDLFSFLLQSSFVIGELKKPTT